MPHPRELLLSSMVQGLIDAPTAAGGNVLKTPLQGFNFATIPGVGVSFDDRDEVEDRAKGQDLHIVSFFTVGVEMQRDLAEALAFELEQEVPGIALAAGMELTLVGTDLETGTEGDVPWFARVIEWAARYEAAVAS